MASRAGGYQPRERSQTVRQAVARIASPIDVLPQEESRALLAAALPDWRVSTVALHALGEETSEPRPDAPEDRIFEREVPPLPPDAAASPTVPIAATSADGLPVSFCYPVWQTEAWWDVSVGTVVAVRGRAPAGHPVATMVRRMRGIRKHPVRGALANNTASIRLATKLGSSPVDRLVVFSP